MINQKQKGTLKYGVDILNLSVWWPNSENDYLSIFNKYFLSVYYVSCIISRPFRLQLISKQNPIPCAKLYFKATVSSSIAFTVFLWY